MSCLTGDDPSTDTAKQMLPLKATLTKDDTLHFRWKIAYPRLEPPYSKTAVWNGERSSRQALMECLKWAWDQHTHVTHEPCPYDLF